MTLGSARTVILVLAFAAGSGQAEEADHAHLENTSEWPVCITFNGIARSPKHIVDNLDKVEMWAPTVPPEEAAYLEKETQAALAVGSPERYNLAAARPYYRAWQLHSDFAKARQRLQTSKFQKLASHLDIKAEISRALGSFYDLSNGNVSWSEFTSTYSVRTPSGGILQNPWYLMSSNILEQTEYIGCLLDLLGDKK